MKKNYHREALAVLEHQEAMNKEAMLWWIAKKHPSVFVWAARMTTKKDTKKDTNGELVHPQVLSHIKDGNMLQAIKHYRDIVPGMSLKEAKNYCDNLRASMWL